MKTLSVQKSFYQPILFFGVEAAACIKSNKTESKLFFLVVTTHTALITTKKHHIFSPN
jgi:hypothetical protein